MTKNVLSNQPKNPLVYNSDITQKRVDLNGNMLIKDSPEPLFSDKDQSKQQALALTSLNFRQLPDVNNKFFTPVVSQRGYRNQLRVTSQFNNK